MAADDSVFNNILMLKGDVSTLKNDNSYLHNKIDRMEVDISELRTEVQYLRNIVERR